MEGVSPLCPAKGVSLGMDRDNCMVSKVKTPLHFVLTFNFSLKYEVINDIQSV